MKAFALLLIASLTSAFVFAESPNGKPPTIQFDALNHRVILSWQPGTLPQEIALSDDLQTWTPWTGTPTGTSTLTADIAVTGPRAFFRLQPSVPPSNTIGVSASNFNSSISLHWQPDPLAESYTIYIGTSPSVGPSSFTQAIHDVCANDFIITGLDEGTTYYVAVYSVNAKGSKPPQTVVSKTFGQTGQVVGSVVLSCPDVDTRPFFMPMASVIVDLRTAADTIQAQVICSSEGRFVFDDVPPGTYHIHVNNNAFVLDSDEQQQLVVTKGAVDAGSVVATPRSGLVMGRVHFYGGQVAAFRDKIFNRTLRALVSARDKDGKLVGTTQVNNDGAFVFTQLPVNDFPFSFEASFKDQTANNSAPNATSHKLIDLVFNVEPARILTAVPVQDGDPVALIDCAKPVTIETQTENEAPSVTTFNWAVIGAGGNIIATSASASPVFNLNNLGEGAVNIHGLIETPSTVPTIIDIRSVLSCGTGSCFTGGVVVWDANAAESLAPISGAVVSAKVGLTTRTATTDANGNFELTDLPFFGPMVLTITKAGYVPWSWRFTGRPSEKEYGMIPVTTTNETVPSAGGQTNEVTLSGAKLLLPPECFTVAGVPFSGAIVVETAPWTFYPRHPFPPDPKFLSNIVLMPANIDSGVWVSVRGGAGEVLTPVVGANAPKLRYITDSHVKPIVLRRDDSKGYFVVEPLPVTTPQVPLYFHDTALTETTAMWASAKSSVTNVMEISADRSLNYPFDVLVGRSAFPVTVQGPGIMDLGRLDITNLGVELPTFFVLDQRQSPGVHYANLDAPQPRATFRKPRIINFSISPQGAGVTAVRLGLGRTLPELIPSNAASGYGAMPPPPATPPWRVSSLETDNAFLAPNEAFSRIDSPWDAHIADTYFTAINAPATLAAWKTRNDFPASLTAVPSTGTFVTAFYYNLGDLGFSRRLSMRKTIAFDGEPNISMAVTNFRTIDEARCDLGPIATVCMEYARRSNGDPQRFVKFTAYDEGGYLLKDISLDGGATKPMPNLCITCHGGRPFDPLTRNGNLGASFLPFDLDSFGYHRKIGTQKPVFAQLNQGVLDTHPAPAIIELIQGWYGNASPLAAPATFNAGFVPPAWQAPAEAPTKYIDVFRNSCRICHISRPESVQFDSYARFNAITAPRAVPGGFSSPVCLIGGGMPATQRSWAIFWGSRAGRKVQVNSLQAPTIPDQPALMLNQPALGDLSNFLRVR